jgi:SM-20-related protein
MSFKWLLCVASILLLTSKAAVSMSLEAPGFKLMKNQASIQQTRVSKQNLPHTLESVPKKVRKYYSDVILTPDVTFHLGKYGYCVLDNFLSKDQVVDLQEDVSRLRSMGYFAPARTGEQPEINQDLRVAEQCFLGSSKKRQLPFHTGRYTVLEKLYQLRNELSDLSFSTLEPELDDLLYVYYPNGGFYRRHIDAIPGTTTVLRMFSVLLYLNTKDWTEQDGGQLRLFLDSQSPIESTKSINFKDTIQGDIIKDIHPIGGRVVILESSRIPHQVIETTRERLVLVGWFCRAPSEDEWNAFSSAQS